MAWITGSSPVMTIIDRLKVIAAQQVTNLSDKALTVVRCRRTLSVHEDSDCPTPGTEALYRR
jgi:hypothetical protein